jgi:hypothetical protein
VVVADGEWEEGGKEGKKSSGERSTSRTQFDCSSPRIGLDADD